MPTAKKKKAPAKKKPAKAAKEVHEEKPKAAPAKSKASIGKLVGAIAIVVVALIAVGVLAKLDIPVMELDVVEDEVEEVVEVEEDEKVAGVDAVLEMWNNEEKPIAGNMSQELQMAIVDLYKKGELPVVDTLKVSPLSKYEIVTVPDKEINKDYCGAEGQELCLLLKRSGASNVSVYHVFEGLEGNVGFHDTIDGDLIIAEVGQVMTSEFTRMYAVSVDMDKVENVVSREIGYMISWSEFVDGEGASHNTHFSFSAPEGPGEEVVAVKEVQDSEGAPEIRVTAEGDAFVVKDPASTDVVPLWETMYERPKEIWFSVNGKTYSYNKVPGEFQVE